jgi:Zn-dependent protease
MTSLHALCSGCSTQMPPTLLSCPSCGRLVHANRLTELAATASMAEKTGDFGGALAAWREAELLLPNGSRQRLAAEEKIRVLSQQVGTVPQPLGQPWWKKASSLGPVGVGLAFLGKAKFLLLGFTKLGTLLSFFVSLSVYWALWGWQFALGLLLSIYVHEMGHVYALSQYGIAASAPMFIPGFGALVRLKQNPANAVEDARVGLAGPVWGLGACLASLTIYALTGNTLFAVIASVAAWLNLFNLIPVWQLDGSRGIRSLTAPQVWMLALLTGGMFWLVRDRFLILIAVLLAYRAWTKRDQASPDWTGMIQFAGLIIALSLFSLIPLPHAMK